MIVEVSESRIHGLGVIAKMLIDEGEWQIVYGQVLHEANQYCFEGNFEPYAPFKFLNHSAVPNCEVVDEEGTLYIVALCPIDAGEELTIDYGEHPNENPEANHEVRKGADPLGD